MNTLTDVIGTFLIGGLFFTGLSLTMVILGLLLNPQPD